jgi:hypothetical protein
MLLSARELSPYDNVLLQDVLKYGGFYNAHAHLDRADTLGDEYLRHINTTPLKPSSLPLSVKQNKPAICTEAWLTPRRISKPDVGCFGTAH